MSYSSLQLLERQSHRWWCQTLLSCGSQKRQHGRFKFDGKETFTRMVQEHRNCLSTEGCGKPPWKFSRLVWTKTWLTWPCICSSLAVSQKLDKPHPEVYSSHTTSVIHWKIPKTCHPVLLLTLSRKRKMKSGNRLKEPKGRNRTCNVLEFSLYLFKCLTIIQTSCLIKSERKVPAIS